jgi:hypothetical protein
MATVTKVLGEFANGLVQVELDYDDATMRAINLRVINGGDSAMYAEVLRKSDRVKHRARFAPGTTQIAIPTTVAARVPIVIGTTGMQKGKITSIEVQMVYPYD